MVIKDKFVLFNGLPNTIKLSSAVMEQQRIEGDRLNLVRSMKIIQKRINHFSSKKIFEVATDIKQIRNILHIVDIDYPLPITYNIRTKKAVINLRYFGVDEISRLDPVNIYACLVNALSFAYLVTGKVKVKDIFYGPITNYLGSIFVRLFGKEFGLLGPYATEINKLKFLIACYVLASFFGIKGQTAYKKAMVLSGVDFRPLKGQLNKYDFSNVNDFIKSLSEMQVLPGMDKHRFANKALRNLQVSFFAAFEDLSRFISWILTSSVKGSNVVPTYMDDWNTSEYNKIMVIGKTIFK